MSGTKKFKTVKNLTPRPVSVRQDPEEKEYDPLEIPFDEFEEDHGFEDDRDWEEDYNDVY